MRQRKLPPTPPAPPLSASSQASRTAPRSECLAQQQPGPDHPHQPRRRRRHLQYRPVCYPCGCWQMEGLLLCQHRPQPEQGRGGKFEAARRPEVASKTRRYLFAVGGLHDLSPSQRSAKPYPNLRGRLFIRPSPRNPRRAEAPPKQIAQTRAANGSVERARGRRAIRHRPARH
jgi:hypothetical protein